MLDVAIVQHLKHFYDSQQYGLGYSFISLSKNVDLNEYILGSKHSENGSEPGG